MVMRRFDLNSESVRMCLGRAAMLLAMTVFVALFSALFAGRAHADVLEVRIASGTDDAEENPGGAIDLTSSDLEIGAQGGGGDAPWGFTELPPHRLRAERGRHRMDVP